MKVRPYQDETVCCIVDALYSAENSGEKCNPLAAVPTGAGKTFIICELINYLLSESPEDHILIISHNAYILGQNHEALEEYFETEIGLYSAGLKSKTIKKITVAGIQSAYRKPELFEHFTYVIIDEAHMIPFKKETMYRGFLKQLNIPCIGLTATPYRLDGGKLHTGTHALFTHLVCDYTDSDSFVELIDEGYLSKMFSPDTAELAGLEFDVKGLPKRGLEYKPEAAAEKFNRKEITEEAIKTTMKYGEKYKKWIIFAINIEHAESIKRELDLHGVKSECIHSKKDKEHNQKSVKKLKNGEIKAVIGIDMLTTGFNVPDIDLIVMLRPTESPVVHTQSIGRGFRPAYAEGYDIDSSRKERLEAIKAGPKQHCLVLDFAGNTKRLGPVNYINVKDREERKRKGEPITKTCPNCKTICAPAAKTCYACGFSFEFKEKLEKQAAEAEIVRRKEEQQKILQQQKERMTAWHDVKGVNYSTHHKIGKPSSMKVTYLTGLKTYNEWVTIDHRGYAKQKAINWIEQRWNSDSEEPDNLADLLENTGDLRMPKRILVSETGRFPEIMEYDWG